MCVDRNDTGAAMLCSSTNTNTVLHRLFDRPVHCPPLSDHPVLESSQLSSREELLLVVDNIARELKLFRELTVQ